MPSDLNRRGPVVVRHGVRVATFVYLLWLCEHPVCTNLLGRRTWSTCEEGSLLQSSSSCCGLSGLPGSSPAGRTHNAPDALLLPPGDSVPSPDHVLLFNGNRAVSHETTTATTMGMATMAIAWLRLFCCRFCTASFFAKRCPLMVSVMDLQACGLYPRWAQGRRRRRRRILEQRDDEILTMSAKRARI